MLPPKKPYPKGWIKRELDFQDWYSRTSSKLGLLPNPDMREQYYDYRGFYEREPGLRNEALKASPGFHFPDTYKQPGHPTFSDQSMYSTPGTPGGQWKQNAAGQWEFHHSPYTYKHRMLTDEYLNIDSEGQETPVYFKGKPLNRAALEAAKAAVKFKKS